MPKFREVDDVLTVRCPGHWLIITHTPEAAERFLKSDPEARVFASSKTGRTSLVGLPIYRPVSCPLARPALRVRSRLVAG